MRQLGAEAEAEAEDGPLPGGWIERWSAAHSRR